MSEYYGQGDVADSNPIAAANREALRAKEQAVRDAEAAKRRQEQELALEERQRKREEARLEREARLAEQIKERTAAYDIKLERERREKAEREAVEAAQRKAEEEGRLNREKEEALAEQRRRQAEEMARLNAIAAERAERESQRQQAENRRMEQLRQAEREAEEIAEMLALQRKVEDAIFMAVTAGALKSSESTDLRLRLRGSSKTEKEQMFREVEARIEASRPRRQVIPEPVNGEEEVFFGFDEANPEAAEASGGEDEGENDAGTDNTADTALLVAKQVLLKNVPAKDIVARLQDASTVDEATMSLLRFLSKELAMGAEYFKKRLQAGIPGLKLEETLEPLKTILKTNLSHTPALMSLGLMAFTGHTPLYKKVCELDVIPSKSNQWIGCVLGCRLYHEYINWLERSKVNTALPWTINAEVEFGKLPGKAKDKAAREKQRAAANAKVAELVMTYGLLDGPSPDLKEAKHTSIIMLKFDIIASSLDGVSQIISSQLVQNEEKVAQAVKAQLSDDAERRARQALGDARGEVSKAEVSLRLARADTSSLESQISEAERRILAAGKRQEELKNELEVAMAQVAQEEAKNKKK